MMFFSREFLTQANNIKTNNLSVSVSNYTTWYIDKSGNLYGCGYNKYGQQGSGNLTDVTTFTQRASNVAQVVCSEDTTWYIDKDGNLYGCGLNGQGQQGSGDTTNVLTFTKRIEEIL